MPRAIARLISLILFATAMANSPVAAAVGGALREALHPQDGPHADLRFDLRSDAFVADISMNLVFLDYYLDTEREQPDRLELSELMGLQFRLQQRMAELCRVTIDGHLVAPTLEALAMNDPDESLLPLFPRSGSRGLRKIKFAMRWPLIADAAPRTVSIVWQAYPPDELSIVEPKPPLVLAAELTAEGVRSQIEFRQDEPEFTWRSVPGGMQARLFAVPVPVTRAARTVSIPALACAVLAAVVLLRALRASIDGRRARAPWTIGFSGAAVAVALAWSAPWMRVALPGDGPSIRVPSGEEAVDIFRPHMRISIVRSTSLMRAQSTTRSRPALTVRSSKTSISRFTIVSWCKRKVAR